MESHKSRLILFALLTFTLTSEILLAFPTNAKISLEKGTLIFLLDNSGSMGEVYKGDLKLNAAKDSIRNAITPHSLGSIKMGLIELGGHCEVMERVEPEASNHEVMLQALDHIRPRPYLDASTPIAEGIKMASEILQKKSGPSKIVLVSDGEANCMGKEEFPLSACDMIASLKRQKINFELSLIGYGVDYSNNKQLKCITELSDNVYKPRTPVELDRAIDKEINWNKITPSDENIFDQIMVFVDSSKKFFESLQGSITALIGLITILSTYFVSRRRGSSNNKMLDEDEFWR